MSKRVGPIPHRVHHARIVEALRRGARCRWDTYEPYGVIREPGTGERLWVTPWNVEAAYREIVAKVTNPGTNNRPEGNAAAL